MSKKITNYKSRIKHVFLTFLLLPFAFLHINAQEMPPEPTSPRPVKIPKIVESKLPNGLRIVVVERKNVPLVSVNLMISAGAGSEEDESAGLVNSMASLLTKGTTTRNANAIAEQMEFLGSSISSGAGWTSTNISFSATTDKIDSAMAIFSDVVLHPTFPVSEINLFKTQTLDELNVGLKQPGTLGRYVAARYTFGEHPASGTPETLKSLKRTYILNTYKSIVTPGNSVLIFTGDITQAKAKLIAGKFFGSWKNPRLPKTEMGEPMTIEKPAGNSAGTKTFSRILVVDLPNSGQASVSYARKLGFGRIRDDLYSPANVLNSLLGGGYSSRMNQEIRIKRGLSYGAGSSISWRLFDANFSTRCQTKTVSAAEVAELTIKEIDRLANENASDSELTPRKNVLNGNFGRTFETNGAISGQVADLLTFSLPMNALDSYISNNEKVTGQEVRDFAMENLKGGDIIIVGDYKDFKDDLAKRFPKQKIEVIKADELDLNKPTLRK